MAATKPTVEKPAPAASAPAKAAPKPTVAKKPAAAAKPTATKPAAATAPAVAPKAPAAPKAAPARSTTPRARPVISPGSGKVIKLKDLLDHVVKATGGKKKAIKETVTATLEALGAALSRGDGLNLPSLGKAQVNRQRTLAEGEMIIVKLRRHDPKTGAKKPGAEPLAKADKEG